MSRLSVSIKLAFAVCILCAGIVALVTWSNIARQSDAINQLGTVSLDAVQQLAQARIIAAEQEADVKTTFIVDVLASVSGDALASYNIDMLDNAIAAVLVDPSIVHVAFMTVDGIQLTDGGAVPEGSETVILTKSVESNGVVFGEVTVTRSLEPIRVITEESAQLAAGQEQRVSSLSSTLAVDTVRSATVFGAIAVVLCALSVYGIVVIMIGRPLRVSISLIARITKNDTDFERPKLALRKDEIGQLGQAIDLFRKTVVEADTLQQREAERKALELAQEASRVRDEAERTVRENEARIAKAAREKEQEEAQRVERDALRKQADQERQRLLDEQSAVVDELAISLKSLSAGQLNVKIDTQFEGAYEALRLDFNKTVDALRSAIEAVALHTSSIRSETSEIYSSASDLAGRTEKQASKLEETATTLNQLSSSVLKASKDARVASDKATSAQRRATESGEVASAAVNAMGNIQSSSEKIANIIKVIDDIAFQTNLLALNAGVEAARAGEAGRGFAVVATEVRALAQRSADAAQEINDLITSSEAEVRSGVTLVQQTGSSLNEIMASISDVADVVSQIAESTKEQAAGLSEVNDAISNIDQFGQQNAALFEETTEACHALNSETGALAQAVSHFNIATQPQSREPEEDDTRSTNWKQAG